MRGHAGKQKTAPFSVNKETQKMNASTKPSDRLRRGPLAALVACAALFAAMLAAAPAQADYGVGETFDVEFTNQDGTPATQAGSHPFAMTTTFEVNSTLDEFPFYDLSGSLKDLFLEQPAGFIGDTTAVPRCSDLDFALSVPAHFGFALATQCPDKTVVGITAAAILTKEVWFTVPMYNLVPPPGVPARIGFVVEGVPVTFDVGVKGSGEYNVVASLTDNSQAVKFFAAVSQLWGDPSDPAHDDIRGVCGTNAIFFEPARFEHGETGPPKCSVEPLEKPFLTLPSACTGPLTSSYETDSWQEPGKWVKGSVLTHDDAEPPNPQGFTGCGKLDFSPEVESKVSTGAAETGTGMDFNLDFNDEGLTSPTGLAGSEAKKAVVTLPEGMTVDPSVAEGLGVCTPADIARETLTSAPGEGCPNSSKVGTLHVDTPLVGEGIDGSVFVAQQDDPSTTTPGAENPFDSLIALYLVLKNPNLGVIVKLPAKVEPDPTTGRLVTTLENIPQVPFSHFNFHFREGQRPALITPPACGTYTTNSVFTPWSDPANPRTVNSDFQITSGVNGG
ncbi:MAG TPA: hypothetical protein VIP57_07560, partial [Candidatus Dormibacteraeota bacterium]